MADCCHYIAMLLPTVWLCGCNSAFSNYMATIPNTCNLVVSMDVTGLLSFYVNANNMQFLLRFPKTLRLPLKIATKFWLPLVPLVTLQLLLR